MLGSQELKFRVLGGPNFGIEGYDKGDDEDEFDEFCRALPSDQ